MTSSAQGTIFEAGFFLIDDENCTRESDTVYPNHPQKVTRNGRDIVPMGALIKKNPFDDSDHGLRGILYEDVDVTDGPAACSVVTAGEILVSNLPSSSQTSGYTYPETLHFVTETQEIKLPDYMDREFGKLSVTSEEGASSGYTLLTVTGYEKKKGETEDESDEVWAIGLDHAVECQLGGTLPELGGDATWYGLEATQSDDTKYSTRFFKNGQIVTVAITTPNNCILAYGSATVAAKE